MRYSEVMVANDQSTPQKIPPKSHNPLRNRWLLFAILTIFILFSVAIFGFKVVPRSPRIPFLGIGGKEPKTAQEKEVLLEELRSVCFDEYNRKFQARRQIGLPTVGGLLSVDQLISESGFQDIPPQILEQMREFEKQLDEAPNHTKQYFEALAQINVDLTTCYEEQLADYPSLLVKTKELSRKADQQLEVIQRFDFDSFLAPSKPSTATVRLSANATKVVRLRTMCIDSSKSPPGLSEEFFLAVPLEGSIHAQYCNRLTEAQAGTDLEEVQSAVWDLDPPYLPLELPSIDRLTTTLAQTEQPNLSLVDAYRKGIVGVKAYSSGAIIALDVVLTNYVNQDLELDTSCLYFVPASKFQTQTESPQTRMVPLWGTVYKMLVALGETDFQINQRLFASILGNSTASVLGLTDQLAQGASFQGDVIPDDINPTSSPTPRVNINYLPGEGEFPFLPPLDEFDDLSPDELDQILRGFPDSSSGFLPPDALTSQPLGSAGVVDGEGPPMPDDPLQPEEIDKDEIFIEQLRDLKNDHLNDSVEDYKTDPSEKNLKDAVDDIGECQLVGCDDQAVDEAREDLADKLKEEVDNQAKETEKNPSQENLQSLKEMLQSCQSIGCESEAAQKVLIDHGQDPAPKK